MTSGKRGEKRNLPRWVSFLSVGVVTIFPVRLNQTHSTSRIEMVRRVKERLTQEEIFFCHEDFAVAVKLLKQIDLILGGVKDRNLIPQESIRETTAQRRIHVGLEAFHRRRRGLPVIDRGLHHDVDDRLAIYIKVLRRRRDKLRQIFSRPAPMSPHTAPVMNCGTTLDGSPLLSTRKNPELNQYLSGEPVIVSPDQHIQQTDADHDDELLALVRDAQRNRDFGPCILSDHAFGCSEVGTDCTNLEDLDETIRAHERKVLAISMPQVSDSFEAPAEQFCDIHGPPVHYQHIPIVEMADSWETKLEGCAL